jgi:hypothetical protein
MHDAYAHLHQRLEEITSATAQTGDGDIALRQLLHQTRQVLRLHPPLALTESGNVRCAYGVIDGHGDLLQEPWPCATIQALATLWGWRTDERP